MTQIPAKLIKKTHTYQSNYKSNCNSNDYSNGERYNRNNGTFTSAKGQYDTEESHVGRRRSLQLSLPFILTIGLCYAYYHIIKERMYGTIHRVALNTETGQIVFLGKSGGKSQPVKIKPNKNIHRHPMELRSDLNKKYK